MVRIPANVPVLSHFSAFPEATSKSGTNQTAEAPAGGMTATVNAPAAQPQPDIDGGGSARAQFLFQGFPIGDRLEALHHRASEKAALRAVHMPVAHARLLRHVVLERRHQVQVATLPRGDERVGAVQLDVADEDAMARAASGMHLVICMAPPALQHSVAKAALRAGAHFVSTSYTGEVATLASHARERGLVLLPEMGLDPGIDLVMARSAIDSMIARAVTSPWIRTRRRRPPTLSCATSPAAPTIRAWQCAVDTRPIRSFITCFPPRSRSACSSRGNTAICEETRGADQRAGA